MLSLHLILFEKAMFYCQINWQKWKHLFLLKVWFFKYLSCFCWDWNLLWCDPSAKRQSFAMRLRGQILCILILVWGKSLWKTNTRYDEMFTRNLLFYQRKIWLNVSELMTCKPNIKKYLCQCQFHYEKILEVIQYGHI